MLRIGAAGLYTVEISKTVFTKLSITDCSVMVCFDTPRDQQTKQHLSLSFKRFHQSRHLTDRSGNLVAAAISPKVLI
jgi:hypothetical protein